MAEIKTLELGNVDSSTSVETRATAPTRRNHGTGMKKWKKVTLVTVAIAAIIGLAIGGVVWSHRGVVAVQTGKVQREDLAQIVTANGEIKPVEQNQANVNANSFGKITEILVKEGDHVTKGQLLMRTEDVQQAASVDAQKAAVTTSQADLSAQDANVLSAKAALDTAQANLAQAVAKLNQATENFKRGQQLFKDQLAFPAGLRSAHERLSGCPNGQGFLRGASGPGEGPIPAGVVQSRLSTCPGGPEQGPAPRPSATQLAQTIYNSPLDGIVTSLPVHVGENVVPGIQNAVGSLLYQVSNLSIMTVEVKVDETDIPNVKLGQTADVLIDAYPNKTFKGRVTQIGESAVGRTTGTTSGTTSGASATSTDEAKDFKVVVVIDDPPPGLRPGLSATAKITTATRKNAVAVPIQAVTVRMRRELEEKVRRRQGQ